MRIVSLVHQGLPRVGRLDGDEIVLFDIDGRAGALALIDAATPPAEKERIPLAGAALRAPIPLPRRALWCVGRNYHAHAKELRESVFKDLPAPAWPMVFTKAPQTVIGPGVPVRLPGAAVSEQIDYEAELAIVIGRGGRDIARADAMSHVWGATIINDVTARDIQMRHGQWDLGKNLDGFCPMGPWIATSDELDMADLQVRCWVNGELRQNARTADLIFDIPLLVETCSRGITLMPGDIIATGTPAGVGMGMDPPRWLRHGDVVRIEIDGLGALENRFLLDGGAA